MSYILFVIMALTYYDVIKKYFSTVDEQRAGDDV